MPYAQLLCPVRRNPVFVRLSGFLKAIFLTSTHSKEFSGVKKIPGKQCQPPVFTLNPVFLSGKSTFTFFCFIVIVLLHLADFSSRYGCLNVFRLVLLCLKGKIA